MILKNNIATWLDTPEALTPSPPAYLLPWLETQILSEALRKTTPNLSLTLLHQALGQAHPDEMKKLDISFTDDFPLVRQVRIGTTACTNLYCRVIIPAVFYEQKKALFDGLGSRFIGETLLYHQAHVQRSIFEYARLTPQHKLYQEAMYYCAQSLPPPISTLSPIYYARRSLFYLSTSPLLITEVFIHVVTFS